MENTDPNQPFVRKWDGFDHYNFIRWAYHRFSGQHSYTSRWYFEKAEQYEIRKAQERKTYLDKLYRLGKRLRVLDVDYATFDRKMGNPYGWRCDSDYRRKCWYRSDRYEDNYPKKGAHFRNRVPLRITEKKVLSEKEQQRREWRQKKGFARDKGKPYWYGGRKTWAKKYSNREFRRYERRELDAGRYENLFMAKRKDYFDPWMWD